MDSVLVQYVLSEDMTAIDWVRPLGVADVHSNVRAFAKFYGLDYFQTQRELCYELKRLTGSYIAEFPNAHKGRPSKWMPAREYRPDADAD